MSFKVLIAARPYSGIKVFSKGLYNYHNQDIIKNFLDLFYNGARIEFSLVFDGIYGFVYLLLSRGLRKWTGELVLIYPNTFLLVHQERKRRLPGKRVLNNCHIKREEKSCHFLSLM